MAFPELLPHSKIFIQHFWILYWKRSFHRWIYRACISSLLGASQDWNFQMDWDITHGGVELEYIQPVPAYQMQRLLLLLFHILKLEYPRRAFYQFRCLLVEALARDYVCNECSEEFYSFIWIPVLDIVTCYAWSSNHIGSKTRSWTSRIFHCCYCFIAPNEKVRELDAVVMFLPAFLNFFLIFFMLNRNSWFINYKL